jgi:hypothetical protein
MTEWLVRTLVSIPRMTEMHHSSHEGSWSLVVPNEMV